MSVDFDIRPNPAPASAAERASLLANPGFGRVFTDHMVTIRYADGKGWYDARVEARAPIPMDPATAVLHYAQEIFEGLKAYHTAGGGVTMFRPEANAARFRTSAERMAMAPLPDELFLASLHELIKVDRDWIPTTDDGSLYLRPFMFASEVFLGVKPSSEYLYLVIASPVGSYFKGGVQPVSVWVSQDYTRAAPGGTGAAKCGGNYAASGDLREAFACGTAAVITPIGTVRWPDGEFKVADGGSGPVTMDLRQQLVDIQRGRAADRYGSIHGYARTAGVSVLHLEALRTHMLHY